ncbi:Tectonic-2 [Chytridiales sp. JEL 0842]|nr:Tectonic-2 [Chytridiales sp. JEL 0842]
MSTPTTNHRSPQTRRVYLLSTLMGILLLQSHVSTVSAQASNSTLPPGILPVNWTQAALTTTPIDFQSDLGPCICDLTANACDPNCCCDRDCNDIFNKNTIRTCQVQPGSQPIAPFCSNLLLRVNNVNTGAAGTDTRVQGPTGVYRDSTRGMCVIYNNSPIKGFYYTNPGTVYESDNFFSEQMQHVPYTYGSPGYGITSLPMAMSKQYSSYQLGDFMTIWYPNQARGFGFLSLPAPGPGGQCNSANPARFFVSESLSCLRPVDSVQSALLCGPDTVLDIAYYLTGYQIFAGNNTLINVDAATCMDPVTQTQIACINLSPVWNPQTGICSRVATTVGFQFNYVIREGIVVLSNVTLNTVFSDLDLRQQAGGPPIVYVRQKFETTWVRRDIDTPITKSGNPGYITGKPVLFGQAVTSSTSTTSPSTRAIAYYQDPMNGMTLPMDAPLSSLAPGTAPSFSPGTGLIGNPNPNIMTCSLDGTKRTPVLFGQDVSSGCTLQLNFDDLRDSVSCVRLRQFIQDVQTGGGVGALSTVPNALGVMGGGYQSGRLWRLDRVGRFGNANVTRVAEWVPVLVKDVGDKSTPDAGAGTCTSLLTSIDIQFLTADLGSVSNPQQAIIGVRIVNSYSSLSYRCQQPEDCRSYTNIVVNDTVAGTPIVNGVIAPPGSRKQKFRLRSSVSFVKIPDGKARPFVPPPPRLVPMLPDDVFYPFKIPASSGRKLRVFDGLMACAVLTAVLIL